MKNSINDIVVHYGGRRDANHKTGSAAEYSLFINTYGLTRQLLEPTDRIWVHIYRGLQRAQKE
jgi:hypothetical protein